MRNVILWSSVVVIGVVGTIVAILGSMVITSAGPIPIWIAQTMVVVGTVVATSMGTILFWKWSFSIPRWVRMMIVIPIVIGILIWAAIASGFTMFNGTYGVTLNGTFDTCGVSCSVAPSTTLTVTVTVPASTPVAPATVAAPAATIAPSAIITATMAPSGIN